MTAVPPRDARPALRWTGALIVAATVHVAAGAWVLSRTVLVPVDPPAAVLIDMEPSPEPEKPAEPEPRAPEPPPPEPPPPEVPPPDEPPPPDPPPPLPDIPPPEEVPQVEIQPPPVESPPPPPKPEPPKPPPRPVPRPVPRPAPAPAAPAAPAPAPTPAPAAAVPAPHAVPVPANWTTRLFAHLGRYKRYPAEAQQRRQEGTPQVRIVIDRSGRVRSVRLERSSGHPLLDAEALAMVERAQPLPPLPDDVTAPTLEIVVPLRFNLR